MSLSLSLALPLLGSLLSEPMPSHCTVALAGIPASQMRYHQFRMGSQTVVAAPLTSFRMSELRTLWLEGPRYRGSWAVSPRQCAKGWIRLKARPRPARVRFQCLPHRAVVGCSGCNAEVDAHPHDPASFPTFTTEDFHTEVVFEFKAPGYEPLKVRTVIYPGRNVIDARLRRRDGCRDPSDSCVERPRRKE